MNAQNAQGLHRARMTASLVKHSHPMEQTITLGEALDRCRPSDVRQIAWENAKAGIKVPATALLAMALSRAAVRQVAEQFACQEQLKQAKIAVTRTGDKRSS